MKERKTGNRPVRCGEVREGRNNTDEMRTIVKAVLEAVPPPYLLKKENSKEILN